ncbi:MAG: GntR family transcriptional regulator [Spirochaetaceae bacterium]|nr:GntR family transcriptional regulator [Spirochaetaceae bacterium]
MRIVISNSSPDPLYEQIAAQVREQIVGGELEGGAELPSIRTLARELGVSIITTKRAYDDLEAAGFLDSVHGKGTYVATQSDGMIRERRRRQVEESLARAVRDARGFGIGDDELREALELLLREEGS